MPDTPDRSLRAVLTVTVETRPDGGHYFDQADFTAHATEWVRAALKGQHAVDDVTIADQAAELARAQAEAHQYRTALQGVARAAAPVPPSAPADRAAILREAADDLATAFGDPKVKHIGAIAASHLRRRAREIEGGDAGEEQPETPLEKRFRFSERRNDELRAECKRRGKINLEYAEKNERLEKQLDEVRTQLGAEILRAGQAEGELRRLAAAAPAPSRAGGEGRQGEAAEVVAYRDPNSPKTLLCRYHGERWQGVIPVTAEELPDGGVCTFGRLSSLECGRDVLIRQQPGKEA